MGASDGMRNKVALWGVGCGIVGVSSTTEQVMCVVARGW